MADGRRSASGVVFVLALADPAASLERVGGKGTSRARLARAGLPVPDGFHVTTTAYDRFVADNDLRSAILEALRAVDLAQPASLQAVSRSIGDRFLAAAIPQDVAQAIASAYAGLGGEEPVVAVRSSATAADLPDLSFAGQQETYLNVHGLAAVQDAIKCCWASLWTDRAIGYRLNMGRYHGGPFRR